jgi:hypothetical protein
MIKEIKKAVEELPTSAKTVRRLDALYGIVTNLEHIPEEELEILLEKYRKVFK